MLICTYEEYFHRSFTNQPSLVIFLELKPQARPIIGEIIPSELVKSSAWSTLVKSF